MITYNRQGKVSYQISKYQIFFNIFFEEKIESESLKSSLPAAKNAAQDGFDKIISTLEVPRVYVFL